MSDWNDEGLHYVAALGQRHKVRTMQRPDGLWASAVPGHFSSYGVTRGNAIRNACKPVDKDAARQTLEEYNAHRLGKLSDADYFAAIHKRHEANLAAFWEDARQHGEA